MTMYVHMLIFTNIIFTYIGASIGHDCAISVKAEHPSETTVALQSVRPHE